jgi:hypothetical protein
MDITVVLKEAHQCNITKDYAIPSVLDGEQAPL